MEVKLWFIVLDGLAEPFLVSVHATEIEALSAFKTARKRYTRAVTIVEGKGYFEQ